jgi:hypothetical protein
MVKVHSQDALMRLLTQKAIFTKDEVLEKVKVVKREMESKGR